MLEPTWKIRRHSSIGAVAGLILVLCAVPARPSAANSIRTALGGVPVTIEATIVDGTVPGSGLGRAMAVGDFNNDGYDDLAIGLPDRDVFIPARGLTIEANGGAIRCLLGGPGGFVSDQLINGYEIPGWGPTGGIVDNEAAIGTAIAAGDFNADGFDDLAVGAPGKNSSSGEVAIIPGGPSGLDYSASALLNQGPLAGVVESGDQFGASLAAGDLSGDGVDDLAIGVPGEDVTSPFVGTDAGAVNIVYGVAGSGLETAGNEILHQQTAGVILVATLQDAFGTALVIADLTGDSQPDLAVGVPGEFVNGVDTAGVVQVFAGGPSGIDAAVNVQLLLSQDDPSITGTPGHNHNFGQSLAAGDFDGSGLTDLAVGIPGEDGPDGVFEYGAVLVLYSGVDGIIPFGHQFLTEVFFNPIAGGEQRFGTALTAGDLNNDGYEELVVGSPFDDPFLFADAGEMTVFFGQAGGLESGGLRGLDSGQPEIITMGAIDTLEVGDEFSTALTVGRFFRTSGPPDLAVGVPGRDVGETGNTGMALVLSSGVIFKDGFDWGDALRWTASNP